MAGSPALPVTAGDLLSLEELAHVRRTSGFRGAGLVLHAWGTIAGAIALYTLWPSLITLGVAVVVVGGRQLGLAVLMHEAAHWLLFPNGRMNTWVGRWLCGAPIGADLGRYRRRHHLHHRHTGQPEDPDRALSATYPVSRGRLWALLAADLGGLTAIRDLAAWRPWRADSPGAWRSVLSPLLANAMLAVVLTALGGVQLYLLAWVLPWATWSRLATRVRDIAEHGMVAETDDALRNARTIRTGFLARLALAPYWVNHHLEHHLLVFVPCWKLREVHALLLGRRLGERMERAASYAEVMRRAVTRESLLGVLLAGLLLASCTGVPVPPAYTDEELAARCVRTGGWWRPGSQIAGHCEYKD